MDEGVTTSSFEVLDRSWCSLLVSFGCSVLKNEMRFPVESVLPRCLYVPKYPEGAKASTEAFLCFWIKAVIKEDEQKINTKDFTVGVIITFHESLYSWFDSRMILSPSLPLSMLQIPNDEMHCKYWRVVYLNKKRKFLFRVSVLGLFLENGIFSASRQEHDPHLAIVYGTLWDYIPFSCHHLHHLDFSQGKFSHS